MGEEKSVEQGFKQKGEKETLGTVFSYSNATYLETVLMVTLPFKTKSSNLSQCT